MLKKLQYEETMSQFYVWFISKCHLKTPSHANFQKDPFVFCLQSTSIVQRQNIGNTHRLMMLKNNLLLLLMCLKNCLLVTLLSISHQQIFWFSLSDENAHLLLCWCCQEFQADNHYQFHWHFAPFVCWKERQSTSNYCWTPPHSGVGVFH